MPTNHFLSSYGLSEMAPVSITNYNDTGDLGSLQSDGYLKLTGRIKELIIRGGENIMPDEIEAVISKFDIIDNVKIIGLPSDFFGEEVCACIKLKTDKIFDEEEFRAELFADLVCRRLIPTGVSTSPLHVKN